MNCFRIDVPVASEGFLANAPELDHSDWEPPEVAAEGIVWLVRTVACPTRAGSRACTTCANGRGSWRRAAACRFTGTPPTAMFEGTTPSVES